MTADTAHPEIALRSAEFRPAARLAGWTLLLSALVLGPIFIFHFPGLQDYPNHLARAFILLHRSDPILERLYSVQWAALPNLGWDLWAMGVGRVLSLEWTGKLFLVLSLASILFGCFALNRAIVGRWTFAPLFAVPFLFNTGFTEGFLSFNLGLGCALLATACWISIGEKHWRWRLLVGTLCSTLLYVIHLYGWAIYGIFVLGCELQTIYQAGKRSSVGTDLLRLARDGLQAVPALGMMALAANVAAPRFTVEEFYPPYERIGQIKHLIDVGDDVANLCLVVIAAMFAFIVFRRGWLRFHFELVLPLTFCLVLFFILPDHIAGTTLVSWRILPAGLLAGIASLSPSKETYSRIDRMMAVVTLMTAVIVGVQIWSWHNSEVGTKDFLALIRDVPEGSELFVVHDGMTPDELMRHAVGLYHVGAYAVPAKRALVQSMFVSPGQQPLRYRDPAFQAIPGSALTFLNEIKEQVEMTGFDFVDYVRRFDYVVVHGPDGNKTKLLPADILTLVNRVGDFRLYRVSTRRS